MTLAATPKMSPAARQLLDQLVAESQKLNEQTEAEALIEKRQAAQEKILSQGLPTRKDEDWQYTALMPLFKHTFEVKSAKSVTLTEIQPFLPELDAIRLTFIDGVFSEELSAGFDFIPEALSIEMADADAIQSINLAEQADAFQLMNEMLLDQGLTLSLEKGQALQVPLHILHVQTQSEQLINLRTQIDLAENSEMMLIQQFVSLDDGQSALVNDLVKVTVADNARFKQIVLQDMNADSFYFANQFFEQAASSVIETNYVGLGCEISRHQNYLMMLGEHAESMQNSIGLGTGKQVIDSRTSTTHQAAHCDSRQLHKLVLDDQSRGVFNGMIHVVKGAQKTDGQMDNKNLLLSKTAKVDAKPQLEIYADDVKCSHGCASGQIDEQQVFYAQARGIRKADALQLITRAFLLEPLESVSNLALRNWLTEIISRKLAKQ
ncbi:Fe-S cluster assembly protein SufD [Hydrogenovibrio sp. 3SP14C1]|uniref:Fe-S cluster assembly protein SufD n=1 Tax=Hydrogenovibrio sp. 3SP14C1 TaxID=3038774 RepID=UPI00241648AB|nr:Fe-S cluster assembly protein SufD [Hydrogenovibrio sp. 3SP14C1]MDG4811818.1 Fe-S cluster assembly protein SufD [Hydrogenovibrio sp. 3SP14C1]